MPNKFRSIKICQIEGTQVFLLDITLKSWHLLLRKILDRGFSFQFYEEKKKTSNRLQSTIELRANCVPTVVVVVGRERRSDLWGYAGRAKVRNPTKRATGTYAVRLEVEVHFRDTSAHSTWLCKWTKDGVTPEEDPNPFKKARLRSAK